MDREQTWDLSLHIKTTGRDDTHADEYHHPYEPTPYCVLERMAESGFFRAGNTVLDYGCGKGRVGFFLSDRTGAKTIGIEYDPRIYADAMENRRTCLSRCKPDFLLMGAEEYAVPPEADRCYFFNPFSVEILRAVCARIIGSWYEAPRDIFLFFYYPSDEFIACLMTLEELEFYDEIECGDLFPGGDPRERVMIFWLPDYGRLE